VVAGCSQLFALVAKEKQSTVEKTFSIVDVFSHLKDESFKLCTQKSPL